MIIMVEAPMVVPNPQQSRDPTQTNSVHESSPRLQGPEGAPWAPGHTSRMSNQGIRTNVYKGTWGSAAVREPQHDLGWEAVVCHGLRHFWYLLSVMQILIPDPCRLARLFARPQ